MILYLSLATVSSPEKVFSTDLADHYGCVLVHFLTLPGQLTLSPQRKAIVSLAFGRSAVLDLLLYFACFVLWLLLSFLRVFLDADSAGAFFFLELLLLK